MSTNSGGATFLPLLNYESTLAESFRCSDFELIKTVSEDVMP